MIEQRPLGNTGLTVSALGFGCGAVGGLFVKGSAADQQQALERAVEAGITYFDTAASYGDGRSEENLGRALNAARPKVVVGTKFRLDAGDESDVEGAIRGSLERSLTRLQRERVDLFQLHNAIGGSRGLAAEQVLGPVVDALTKLRQEGKIGQFGVTAMGETPAIRRVVESGRFGSAQVYFNAVNPSAGHAGVVGTPDQNYEGLIDAAATAGVGVINIRPLAAGALAGVAVADRPTNAGDPGGGMAGSSYTADLDRAATLTNLAGTMGLEGPVEMGLRFVLAKRGVSTVIVGFSDPDQLEDAIRYAGRGPLPPEAVERVLAVPR